MTHYYYYDGVVTTIVDLSGDMVVWRFYGPLQLLLGPPQKDDDHLLDVSAGTSSAQWFMMMMITWLLSRRDMMMMMMVEMIMRWMIWVTFPCSSSHGEQMLMLLVEGFHLFPNLPLDMLGQELDISKHGMEHSYLLRE